MLLPMTVSHALLENINLKTYRIPVRNVLLIIQLMERVKHTRTIVHVSLV